MSRAAIHAGLRALGLAEEEDRRALYARVTGKQSLREMAPRERQAVLDELRRLGWVPRPRADRLAGPYAAKLRALWIAGWNLALVREPGDRALAAFVRRQTGLDHPRWLTDPVLAEKAVEGLKIWLARDGGVVWTPPRGTARSLRDPRARVAEAQWRRLPEAPEDFLEALAEVLGREVERPYPVLAPEDWQAVMNLWGARLRREGGA